MCLSIVLNLLFLCSFDYSNSFRPPLRSRRRLISMIIRVTEALAETWRGPETAQPARHLRSRRTRDKSVRTRTRLQPRLTEGR
jgi:hypothetical protein